jgi:hypothetical protein
MTARWALVMMGAFATILALVPFVAFIYGPKIRARSKYSRLLISKEHEALQTERYQREARGMDLTGLDEADE